MTPVFMWDGTGYRDLLTGLPAVARLAHDWSDTNQPWAGGDPEQGWPTARTVDLIEGPSPFYDRLMQTVVGAGERVVVRLPEGVHSFTDFIPIGNSGDPTYSFGFWHPNLQGLIGAGPTKTFVQMDADSMTQAQLDALSIKTLSSFAPNQMGLIRLDGSAESPVLIGGLTFRSADQDPLTAVADDLPPIYLPQPAPHQGVVIYPGSHGIVNNVRFQGAGRAMTSQPPFEHANVNTQHCDITWRRCEFDGRRSPDLDPAQPRRCGPVMFNNEAASILEDCWLHHSNVSRYAVNDENSESRGTYALTRCKVERITDTQNRDPALNSGDSLGGYTNATPLGWESVNGTIAITDCIVSQDNPHTDRQIPAHLQLTSVGHRDPQGGRLTVVGGDWRNTAHPYLDGFLILRIQPTTHWWTDGFDTTLDVRPHGTRLAPHVVTGTWPPSPDSLASADISPSTHYLVRSA